MASKERRSQSQSKSKRIDVVDFKLVAVGIIVLISFYALFSNAELICSIYVCRCDEWDFYAHIKI